MTAADLLVFLFANAPVVIAVTLFLMAAAIVASGLRRDAGRPADDGSRGVLALISPRESEPRPCSP